MAWSLPEAVALVRRPELDLCENLYWISGLTGLSRVCAVKHISPLLYLKRMLGHASIVSTQFYLASLESKTETVLKDIEYLYGDVIGDDDFGVHPKLGTTELQSLVGNQQLT